MDFVTTNPAQPASRSRAAIQANCRIDEAAAVGHILAAAEIPAEMRDRIADKPRAGSSPRCAASALGKGGLDAFLHEYALSSPEGVALMCLAEALLRIPDAETVDRLIRDKIAAADLGAPSRPFRIAVRQRLDLGADADRAAVACRAGRARSRSALRRFVARSGEPVCAPGGDRRDAHPGRPVRHGPHDRGGARARTRARAARLPPFLRHARRGGAHDGRRRALPRRLRQRDRRDRPRRRRGRDVEEAPGISVKLSALHPRYEMAQRDRVLRELLPLAARSRAPGARRRHRLHDRRRGSRPARTVARPRRGAGARARARRLGRARPRGAGLPEAGAAGDRLARRSGPARRAGG